MSREITSGKRPLSPRVQPKRFYDNGRLSHYTIEEKLGQGTFGIVYKGRQKKSRKIVAIKRILLRDPEDMYPVTAFREMNTVKRLRHENIVELLEMVFDSPAPEEPLVEIVSKLGKSFYMVLPYMSFDLTGILQNPAIQLSEADNKSVMLQLFRGMDFIHRAGYLHRDIKASNILINCHGLLKIADFGLAREYVGKRPTMNSPGGGHPMTEVVMTRWYRAPEVLLGNKAYTTAIDMWACGCVLGELYEKKPILPGKSDIDQAYDIFTLIGEPNDVSMPGYKTFKMTPKLVIQKRRPTISERFSKLRMPADAIRLLTNLLTLNAETRYTAQKCLSNEWFTTEPLPKERISTDFPDCHESDVLKRKEEARQNNNGEEAHNLSRPTGLLGTRPREQQRTQQPPQQPQQPQAQGKEPFKLVAHPRNDFVKKPYTPHTPAEIQAQQAQTQQKFPQQHRQEHHSPHHYKKFSQPHRQQRQHPHPQDRQESRYPQNNAPYPQHGNRQLNYAHNGRNSRNGQRDDHPPKRPKWEDNRRKQFNGNGNGVDPDY
ncbi:CRK1 [Cyberlindnera jadinii]|uniref:Serine/threonine-protein kinase BUR1 n=2 Tax=Cyberlindnera jadinii (strain ATCC 18201 / CBS 1600 / BCRC 20928 / JCM 3617 / NBRC 0987 / NRRL Y-1542) TaxID=983966 RepID=A0A0H5CIR9_CYBJN|nr:CRK1 [Cyberlindnera jadinii]